MHGYPSDPTTRGGHRRRPSMISMGLFRTRMLGKLAFLAALLAVSAFAADANDVKQADLASRPSRFKLAVLATFPRSGTTWTRALFRAAAGLVTGSEVKKMVDSKVPAKAWPASAGRPPPTQLHQLLWLHKATQQDASDKDIVTFLLENQLVQWYNISRDISLKWSKGEQKGVKAITGGTLEHCLSPGYAIELNSVTLATLPPIVLKSHAPTISHGDAVLNLLNSADVRIHTIRNAVDNIVSKFHGNPKAFSERKGTSKGSLWDDLISARKRNQTTAQFDKYLTEWSKDYSSHHQFWIDFAARHGATRPSVFFMYEAMVQDTARLLPALLQKVGFSVDDKRIRCALSAFPGIPRPYPEHGSFYTPSQRAVVEATTSSVSEAAGYSWGKNGELIMNATRLTDLLSPQ